MKSIFIIRHAEAEDLQRLPDSFRGLTKRGSAQANEMGTHFTSLPPHWLVSPAVRTYSTAYILASHQTFAPQIHLLNELYMSSGDTYLNCLFALPNEINSVVIVGHNPSVSELFFTLTKQGIAFKKGCVAEIQSNTTDWVSLMQHPAACVSIKVPSV
jgi:phosphohistidine phosphatase